MVIAYSIADDLSFQPSDLSGLVLWFDASAPGTITKDGSNLISSWSSRVGGLSAVQATTLQKPLAVASAINGRPAVQGRHDGTNASNLAVADNALLDCTSCYVMAVAQRVVDMGAIEFIAGKTTNTGNMREHNLTISSGDKPQFNVSLDGTATTTASGANNNTVGTPYILEGMFSANLTTIIRNNGTPVTNAAPSAIFNGTSPYYLLSRDSNATPFAGYLGDYIYMNRVPTATERRALLNYMSPKYGITIF